VVDLAAHYRTDEQQSRPNRFYGVGNQTRSEIRLPTELSPGLSTKRVPCRSTNQCPVDDGSCQYPTHEDGCRKQEPRARARH
jgi:hypothetical protein